MPAPTGGCLFTIVKNTSGASKKFGFLPPHGVTLAADEELHVFGNLQDAIQRGGHKNVRAQNALAQALSDGDLEIKSSPCTVVYDTVDLASYFVGSSNSAVALYNPGFDDEDYTSP